MNLHLCLRRTASAVCAVEDIGSPAFFLVWLSRISMVPIAPDGSRHPFEWHRYLPRQAPRDSRLPDWSVRTRVVVPVVIIKAANSNEPSG